ncbi:MAG TPA: hypothetical protein VGL78_08745 [Solirubrobacteraceae bacterium]
MKGAHRHEARADEPLETASEGRSLLGRAPRPEVDDDRVCHGSLFLNVVYDHGGSGGSASRSAHWNKAAGLRLERRSLPAAIFGPFAWARRIAFVFPPGDGLRRMLTTLSGAVVAAHGV